MHDLGLGEVLTSASALAMSSAMMDKTAVGEIAVTNTYTDLGFMTTVARLPWHGVPTTGFRNDLSLDLRHHWGGPLFLEPPLSRSDVQA